MRRVQMRIAVAVGLLAVMVAGLPAAAAQQGRPQDYTAIEGLSQPVHEVRVDEDRVPMGDGVELAVDIARPDAEGRWPTILVLSPYLGLLDEVTGTAFLGPDEQGNPVHLDGYFAPRGYVVIHAALRGTGRSSGCLQLLGPTDRADARRLIDWIAARPWSDGRIGMAGHSYPAYAAIAAASEAPPALRTIVSSAGGGTMYQHQFQQGVPYGDQILGPLGVYQTLGSADYLTRAPDKRPLDAGCEWRSSTALHTDHVSGVETPWHRDRDVRAAVAEATIPVFATYGTADAAVNLQALDWFAGRGLAGDKLWVGQWGHGHLSVGNDSYPYPNDREEQWRAAVHAWFDRHLQGRDVATGPPIEVFLNDGQVLVPPSWPAGEETLRLYPRGTSGFVRPLAEDPGAEQVTSFFAGPYSPFGPTSLRFDTAPAEEPVLLLGTPVVRLRAALDGPRVNLVARLDDVDPEGRARRIHVRGFAINPELRDGLSQARPVVAGEVMDLEMVGVGFAHRLLPGHRLRLEITTPGSLSPAAGGFLGAFGHGSRVDVHLGGAEPSVVELPVVPEPTLWPDPRG